MSDWAEERAALLWSLDTWQGDLAKELRKAKAEGYLIGAKAAGEYFLDQIHKIMAGGEVPSFEELSANFVARASEIEKGNP